MLAISLPEDIEQRLATLAKRTGQTKAHVAREAILKHLEEMEDYYLAAEAYEEFLESKEKPASASEVRKQLGPDD